MKQLNFRADEELTKRAEQYVDGVHFRSVGHILNVALAEWVARQDNPIDTRDPAMQGQFARHNLQFVLSERAKQEKDLLKGFDEDSAKEGAAVAAIYQLFEQAVENAVVGVLRKMAAQSPQPAEAKDEVSERPSARRRRKVGS
jgi:hypothetical protein